MSGFAPAAGAALLIPSGPRGDEDRKHLFVVLTDPCPKNMVLIVGICSVKTGRYHDPACDLAAGAHEFIRHDSYVDYGNARIESCEALERGVKDRKLILKGEIDEKIFERICTGLTESLAIPQGIQPYHAGHLARAAKAKK